MNQVSRITLLSLLLALGTTQVASAGFWGKVAKPFKWAGRKVVKPAWRGLKKVPGWFGDGGRESHGGSRPPTTQPANPVSYHFFLVRDRNSRIRPCYKIAIPAYNAQQAQILAWRQHANATSITQISRQQYFAPGCP